MSIGIWCLISDTLLPGKIDIIFFLFKNWSNLTFSLELWSNRGWPTKVFLSFSLSKYFFSNWKSNNMWSKKLFISFTLPSLHAQTLGAMKWIVFIFEFLIFTCLDTLNVKSGLSTLNRISGLNFKISLTVSLILLFIFKKFSITSVKAI